MTNIDFTKEHVSKEQIEEIINSVLIENIKINNTFYYLRSFVHSSLINQIQLEMNKKKEICSYLIDCNKPASNERLEFLGDSYFNAITVSYIFSKFPDKDEGFLTKLKIKIINGNTCSLFSKKLGLHKYLLTNSKNKIKHSDNILGDLFEAFIAAIYLDLGYEKLNQFVISLFEKHVNFNELVNKNENYKEILIRYAQYKGLNMPEYKILENNQGSQSSPQFKIEAILKISDSYIKSIGYGNNKKEAEQKSAKSLLNNIDPVEIKMINQNIKEKNN